MGTPQRHSARVLFMDPATAFAKQKSRTSAAKWEYRPAGIREPQASMMIVMMHRYPHKKQA